MKLRDCYAKSVTLHDNSYAAQQGASYLARMDDAKRQFADRLRKAMESAGYQPRPAVLEREYNLRCWGKPMTLHGVRRWLRGETLPSQEKLLVLAEWLRIPPQELRFGTELAQQASDRRNELENAIRYQEREVFEAFIQLPQEQRKIVREVIMAFSRSNISDSRSRLPHEVERHKRRARPSGNRSGT